MKKTDTFFVISNYNTDPEQYVRYCNDYHIYDQSTDEVLRETLKSKYNKLSIVENTGHNISDYFRFFIDYYDTLPAYMLLAKGNMIGRHVSQAFFDRVYTNKYYTFLYDDRGHADILGVAYQLYDGAFLEINNSWYGRIKEHRYFDNFNDLLTFVFKNPIIPKWVVFSPGSCYIVERNQIRKYPKVFYENLKSLVSYTYFPSEAYLVERMLHIIFCANYELNEWMFEREAFEAQIQQAALRQSLGYSVFRRKFDGLRGLLHRAHIMAQSNNQSKSGLRRL